MVMFVPNGDELKANKFSYLKPGKLRGWKNGFVVKSTGYSFSIYRVKGAKEKTPQPRLTQDQGLKSHQSSSFSQNQMGCRIPPIPEFALESDHKNPPIPIHPGKLCSPKKSYISSLLGPGGVRIENYNGGDSRTTV